MGALSDEIFRMIDVFDDHSRRTAVRFLAAKVARLEETMETISAMPAAWYQRSAEYESEPVEYVQWGVEECADELRVVLGELVER